MPGAPKTRPVRVPLNGRSGRRKGSTSPLVVLFDLLLPSSCGSRLPRSRKGVVAHGLDGAGVVVGDQGETCRSITWRIDAVLE